MFWIRHPKPLLSTKAVAMQVVARKAQAMRDMQLIIVEKPLARETDAAAPLKSKPTK
ncbi:MAG: hypothetical protein V4631_18720 [Pseudomonadota bacterium]